MKLHHIGIATKDIEKTAMLLCDFGYIAHATEFDKEQNVYVKFMEQPNAPCIELIMRGKDNSPVDKIIERNGTCVYHLCYEVEDIDTSVQELRVKGYFPTGRKTKSVIDGRDVIFLFHADNCLIELLEREKNETESL
ncbi:MAG: VOC family protein [Lachnospiraceae bacterium]|nr:VOC family protein [Lachnospiraceae bacterium]